LSNSLKFDFLFPTEVPDIEGLQIVAINRVLNPSFNEFLDKVRRWFAKEYSTPLLQVIDNFDDSYILTCYFENKYEELDPEERRERAEELITPPEERGKQKELEEAADLALLEEMAKELEEGLTRTPEEKKKLKDSKALGKNKPDGKAVIGKVPAKVQPKLEEKVKPDVPDDLDGLSFSFSDK
jgi:hypothetical protein